MAGIDVKSTFDSGRITTEFLQRKLVGMKRAAEFALGDIITRTGAGVGLSGPFPGYSPSYRKFRQKRGNPVEKVDLHLTGAMLQSITTETFVDGNNLVFEIAPSPAQNTKVVYTNERRPWFGLTEREKQAAIDTVKEA